MSMFRKHPDHVLQTATIGQVDRPRFANAGSMAIYRKCLDIQWHTKDNKYIKLGALTPIKMGGKVVEYRVFYVRPDYEVEASGSTNHVDNWVLMDIFPNEEEAKKYVHSVFHSKETLKEEMFNVYLKLLQPLG